jgi:hypothetical protein
MAVRNEEYGIFSPYFIGSVNINDPYEKYIKMTKFPPNYSPIVNAVAERIMEEIHKENIDVMIEADDLPVLFSIPATHLLFLLRKHISNVSQIAGKRITVIAKEISFSSTSNGLKDDTEDLPKKDNLFTGNDYKELIELLQYMLIDFSIKSYRNSFTHADDQSFESAAEKAIAEYVYEKIFYCKDIEYGNFFRLSRIPSLTIKQERHTIHSFRKDHPLIVERKIDIDMDLSNVSTKHSVPEIHSLLMDLLNNYLYDEYETAVLVDGEDDYEYIKQLTKNTQNGSIDLIKHSTDEFIEICRRFYKDCSSNYQSSYNIIKEPVIKYIISLHDRQKGLTNDEFDYPEHPPEYPDELPEPIIPFLYYLGSKNWN